MKKLLSISLAIVLVISAAVFQVFAYTDVEAGSSLEGAVGLLEALDLMEGYDDGEFKPEEEVTRAEFVYTLTMIHNGGAVPSAASAESSPYADVTVSHWAFDSIVYAKNNGILGDSNDGSFRPDTAITKGEAIRFTVNMVGYAYYANANGGYPTGYLAAAKQLDLLNDLSASVETPLTRGEAALLYNNTLHANMYIADTIDSNGQLTYRKAGTVLYEKFDILSGKGIVTANEFTSLNSQTGCGAGRVIVGDEQYEAGSTGVRDLLGHAIEFYYRFEENADRRTMIYTEIQEKENYVSVDAENIAESTTNRRLSYYPEGESKLRTFTIDETADVIRNGVYIGRKAHTLSQEELLLEDGTVTVINNNFSGGADVVLIDQPVDLWVSSVNSTTETVFDKYGVNNISYKGVENLYAELDGTTCAVTGIPAGSIVSAYRSDDGTVVRLYASQQKVTGTLRAMKSDEGKWTIDDTEYKVSPAYEYAVANKKPGAEETQVGSNGDFLLDYQGNIVAFESLVDVIRYGYLVDMASTDMFDQVMCKMYTEDAKLQTFTLASKVAFGEGGTKLEAPAVLNAVKDPVDGSVKSQLVKYSTNAKGEIGELITAGQPGETDKEFRQEWDFSSNTYFSGASMFARGSVQGTNFMVNANTQTFIVPSDAEIKTAEEKKFKAELPGSDTTYDLVAPFSLNEVGVAEAVVIKASVSAGVTVDDYRTAVCLVSEVYTTAGEDGEQLKGITYWQSGAEASCSMTEDSVIRQWIANESVQVELTMNDIHPGDVLHLDLDDEGNLKSAVRVFPQKLGAVAKEDPFFTSMYSWSNCRVYGQVNAILDGVMRVNVSSTDPTQTNLFSVAHGPRTYVYDVARQTVTMGSVADITGINTQGVGSYMYIRAKDRKVEDIVIYLFEE